MTSQLRRDLRLRDIVALGINSVIGTGIFFLPGEAAAILGPAALIPFLVSAVLCSLLVLCFADAGSRFRETGGPMLYAEAAFGPLTGFVVGWMTVVVRIATWGALSNALVTALAAFDSRVSDYRVVVLCSLFAGIAAVNCSGIRSSAAVTNFFTLAKLLPILLFVVVGAFFIDPALFEPFAPHGYSEVGAGTLLILFAFVGFELLGIPAGEMSEPRKNLPRALFLSMSLITVVYLSIWAVCTGTLPTLAGSATPVSDAAAVFMGTGGGLLVSVGIVMSVLGVNVATSLAASRCLFALGDQGRLPRIFGRVHARTGAPVQAILATTGLALAVALSGTFVELAVLSVVARFSQFIPTCLAVLVGRRRGAREPRFRIPLGPAIPVLALLLCGWLLSQAEPRQLLWGSVAIAVGVVVFFAGSRRKRGSSAVG